MEDKLGSIGKRKKVMKLIILLVIIALLAATITQLLFYYFKYVYKVKETVAYAMKLKVDNYVGFNLDPGEINFGTVTPGGAGHREIYLKVNESTKVEIILE